MNHDLRHGPEYAPQEAPAILEKMAMTIGPRTPTEGSAAGEALNPSANDEGTLMEASKVDPATPFDPTDLHSEADEPS